MTQHAELVARLRRDASSVGYLAADVIEALVAENAQLLQSEADLTGRFTEIAPCDPGDMPSLIAARALAAHRAVVAERDAATAALRQIVLMCKVGLPEYGASDIQDVAQDALAAHQPMEPR
jgi:hypothetical protein